MRSFLLIALYLSALPAFAQRANCEDGTAQPVGSAVGFPCSQVDLLSRLPLAEMGNAVRANDIWGWTDGTTGSEYALVGLLGGTAFVDVTEPEQPVYLGTLPGRGNPSTWRDIKVYADHAFVVSEASGHGMQVFDLTQLRGLTGPVTLSETTHYGMIGSSHNVFINEDTGFAYIVGAGGGTGCTGGLHMVDLAEPANPEFAGCFDGDGYTHDVQCVIYDGPDTDYSGSEICFASNEDTVTLVDVTDKSDPVQISQAIYPNTAYTHQGWLTEDQRYFIGNDEADESQFGINTRTLVFDVQDLDDPSFRGAFSHDTPAIDHNLYVVDQFVYETNDAAGLRILDATALLTGGAGAGLDAAAFFDTYPESDAAIFEGSWSNYPFFESGIVIVSDRSRGLFVLQPRLTPPTATGPDAQPETFGVSDAYPNPFATRTTLVLRAGDARTVVVGVYDVLGRRIAEPFRGALASGEERTVVIDGDGWPAGAYFVRVTGAGFAETRRVTLIR